MNMVPGAEGISFKPSKDRYKLSSFIQQHKDLILRFKPSKDRYKQYFLTLTVDTNTVSNPQRIATNKKVYAYFC